MSAYSNTDDGSMGFLKLMFFLFIVGIVIWIAVGSAADQSKSHAGSKHGEDDAAIIRDNIDRGNIVGTYCNPDTLHTAVCAEVDNDPEGRKYGIQILDEDGSEITAFFKEKFKELKQLLRYLTNTGYNVNP